MRDPVGVSGLLIGYARCSPDGQDLTVQRDALATLGMDLCRSRADRHRPRPPRAARTAPRAAGGDRSAQPGLHDRQGRCPDFLSMGTVSCSPDQCPSTVGGGIPERRPDWTTMTAASSATTHPTWMHVAVVARFLAATGIHVAGRGTW